MIIVWVVVAIVVGAVGVKWMHNEPVAPIPAHKLECVQKDCKCDVLEAGKVIVK